MDRSEPSRSVGRWMRRALPATALVGAVLGVTAVGPGAFSALASGLRHRAETGVVVAPSVQPSTSTTSAAAVSGAGAGPTGIIASPPPAGTAAPAPVPTVPTSSAPSAPSDSSPAATSPAAAAVTTIQIVPAARDVVVQIDGARYASAGDGTITLPAAARHGNLEFIGFVETPPLRQAAFGTWADGSTIAARSLDTLVGPVVQLGVTISYRVVVDAPGADTVAFFSALGAVDLPVGTSQWVPAVHAVVGSDGLVAQPLNYTVQSVGQGGQQTPVIPSSYTPTPEALWKVSTT